MTIATPPDPGRQKSSLAPTPGAVIHPERMEETRRRLIVALDAPDAAAALDLASRPEGRIHWFKVGLELFTAAGPAVLEPLASHGHSVFVDLKL